MRTRFRAAALLLLAAVLIGAGALGLHAARRAAQIAVDTPAVACCSVPSGTAVRPREVRVAAPDGLTLQCWLVPSSNRAAVLLLHGESGDRLATWGQLGAFARAGYGALSCDRRGHGATGGRRSWGWLDVADAGAMLAALAREPSVDPQRIGVYGVSMGAQVALRLPAERPGVRAVVAEGAVPTDAADLAPPEDLAGWPRFALDWADQWVVDRLLERSLGVPAPRPDAWALAQPGAPVTLIVAAGQTTRGAEARQAAWLARQAGGRADLWVIPEAQHAGGFSARPEEYARRALALFDAALLGR